MRLFITRPQKECNETSKRLKNLGHQTLEAPLFEIEAIKLEPQKEIGALIVTSLNGVRSLGHLNLNKSLPVFTVGDRTANEAQKNGFQNIHSAKGTEQDLIALILEKSDGINGKFIHFSGENIKGDLVGALKLRNIKAKREVTYRAKALNVMPKTLLRAIKLKEIDGGVFYSGRAATTFNKMIARNGLLENLGGLTAFALSEDIGASLKELGWKNIIVAKAPNEDELFKQIETYCLN